MPSGPTPCTPKARPSLRPFSRTIPRPWEAIWPILQRGPSPTRPVAPPSSRPASAPRRMSRSGSCVAPGKFGYNYRGKEAHVSTGITAALSLAAAALAQQPAQPSKASDLPPMPDQSVRVTLQVSGEIGFAADFKDSGGDLSILRAGADVDVAIPVEYAQLNLGFAYEHLRYEFNNTT